MVVLTSALTWVPLYVMLFYLVLRNNESMKQMALLLTCAIFSVCFADLIVDTIVKPMCMRWRPSQDPYLKYAIDVVGNYRGGKYGFFSAHAANTMSVAVFFALVVRSKSLSVMLILWSILNGYTRIYLGVHYPSDVLVGFAWGTIIAVVSYMAYRYIYRKITPNTNYISSQYTSTGYSYSHVYMTISVLLLTILYAMIRAVIMI